jgi:hypothetical protein
VLLSPTLGDTTRRASLDGFKNLFEPGAIATPNGRPTGDEVIVTYDSLL